MFVLWDRDFYEFLAMCKSNIRLLRRCKAVQAVLFLCGVFVVESVTDQSLLAQTSAAQQSGRKAIIVIGASGEESYRPIFREWAERWKTGCQSANIDNCIIDGAEEDSSIAPNADKLSLTREIEAASAESVSELWLVLIGHGTFDGKIGKFNLRGEDLSSLELEKLLASHSKPIVFAGCFSCSGAFLPVLSKKGRTIVTATKNGAELNFSRFGDFFSKAIGDPTADLDHDRSVSILEAFLKASKETSLFYSESGRLATEHALLDDSGDKKGVSADFFRGTRQVKQAEAGAVVDGEVADLARLIPSEADTHWPPALLAKRTELENQVRELRQQKPAMNLDVYFAKLESLANQIAAIYQDAAKLPN